MTALQLYSPAKLNLFLHITGRRADGYHTLQTLFQLLDSGDDMRFVANDSGAIELAAARLELPVEQNLAWRAATLLQQQTGCAQGVAITLDKRLPVGGGVGGGSSNAATTLLALNRLWRLGLSLDQLAQTGLGLGADVPLFVRGHSAWAEGTGEQLQALSLPPSHYLVIEPNCAVATATVFSRRELTRNTAPITMAAFFAGAGRNDCQNIVRRLYPEVDKALNWLENFGRARVTGSGACVFTSCTSAAAAAAVLQQLPAPWRGFVATGINRSPVHAALGY